MRIVIALASAVRAATALIRWHRFWRVLYRAIDGDAAPAALAAIVRAVRRVRGEPAAEALLGALDSLFVGSGWPRRSPGWVNLHMSRFLTRVRRRSAGSHPVRAAAPARREGPLRVGCLGHFSGLLSYGSRHLFELAPRDVDLHLFDLEFRHRLASYLEGLDLAYTGFPVAPDRSSMVAGALNAAGLDVLLNFTRGREAHEILDRVDTPFVVQLCSGSDLLHHERVAFSVLGQIQADYPVVGRALFCATSRSWFGPETVLQGASFWDPAGIDSSPARSWGEREPLVVVHGALYKAVGLPFLELLAGLLREDESLELVLAGKDDGGSRELIEAVARSAGVSSRVHVERPYDSLRGAAGEADDAGRSRLFELLGRARLAPDPWPLGGGSTRAEAYGLGAPTAHMGVRFERSWWGRPQHSVVEIEALAIPEATATTIEGYREICTRCLYDEAFADGLAAKQLRIFEQVTDPSSFWTPVLGFYRELEPRVRNTAGAEARL